MAKPGALFNGIMNCAYVLFSILALLWPAFHNGFPLVYSDTGAYIASGFEATVPVDRPVMYSFFVRHISLATSLWFVVVAQAGILYTIMTMWMSRLFGRINCFRNSFFIVSSLALLTSVAFYTSQIMPDIFAPIAILCFALLITYHDLNKGEILFAGIVLVFSSMAHSSVLLTATLALVLFVLIGISRKKINKKPIKRAAILILAAWLLIPTLNWTLNAGFKVSRAPNIFLIGRLSESGILKDYLREKCEADRIELCRFKEQLPEYSWQFLWNGNSPLYSDDCLDANGHRAGCWLKRNEEYKPVVKDILTSSYLFDYIIFSIKESVRQLNDYLNEDLASMMEDSPVLVNVAWRFKADHQSYISSIQSVSTYKSDLTNALQIVLVPASFLGLLVILLKKKWRSRLPQDFNQLLIAVILGVVLNAVVCATFSMVTGRFQGRVVWLIPFLFVVAIALLNSTRTKQEEQLLRS